MNVLINKEIKRGLKIFIFVSLSLFLIELLKQHSLKESAEFAFFWSSISTIILVLSQINTSDSFQLGDNNSQVSY